MGELISFQDAVQARKLQNDKKQKTEYGYRCYVTLERLNGYCDLLICRDNMIFGEWFHLSFSPEGLLRHSVLQTTTIGQWLTEHPHKEITYLQAIRLLGDAVRQQYKYQKSVDWVQGVNSIHLQRIWQSEYYNDCLEEVEWLLPKQSCKDLLHTLFLALSNRDAVLLYDMSAKRVQQTEKRSMFAHIWNHALEGMNILGYEVDKQSVFCNGADDYTLFLTVYGANRAKQILEVDVCLRLIEEQERFRIVQDCVLEPRAIYSSV